MKAWLKWLSVLVACAALLTAARCLSPKRRIGNFVRDNHGELAAVLRDCWDDPSQTHEYKQHAIHVSTNEVWFDWFDGGLGPATHDYGARYYGFYYSVDESPHPYPGMADYDETVKPFRWRWEQPGGESGCLVLPIRNAKSWYYVEAWF